MSLRSRIFTVLTVAGATVAFSTVGMAQTTPTTTAPTDKAAIEKGHRGWGKGEGKRGEFGMHRGGKGMRHGRMGMGMMFHGLDLTDAQKAQIKAIHEANKPTGDFREEMKAIHAAKKAGTLTADQKARLESIKADRKAKMKSVHEQVLNVLTAEQKAQIETRKAEMKTRMQERRMKRQQKATATPETTSN